MDHWSRRQFVQGVGLTGLALVVGCGRLGQLPSKIVHVGWLSPGLPDSPSDAPRIDRFRQAMAARGWVEYHNRKRSAPRFEGSAAGLPSRSRSARTAR
jgi:hypothetical protein